MSLTELIQKAVQDVAPYAIEQRRWLHTHAEVSLQEVETSKHLKAEVAKLGLPITDNGNTGFIAVLDTGKPGKTLAIRADIDALPMQESAVNLKGKKVAVSENDGACHACGHDAHMAMQLAAMKILCDLKEHLSGKIIFLFEAAEEIGGGFDDAASLVVPLKPDAIYGSHVTSFMPSGTICLDSGPRMAGGMLIDITVKGKGGHGSRPDLSINPLFAATSIVNQLAINWANKVDVTKTATLGITLLQCGTASNIFAEEARIAGSTRIFDPEVAEVVKDIITRVPKLMAQANYCEAEYAPGHGNFLNPVHNDKELSSLARKGALEVVGSEKVVDGVLWFASESFGSWSVKHQIPSVFAFVGIGNPELGSGADHHNIHFDVDDDALATGIACTCKFALDFLS
ncbi:MAG: amidohydrolase [Erysipelotrichaceae bacterium]|jgi:amidohydrolase|nr:amidohydrolase [Erysipelotrichaceae bacterium]